VPVCPCARACVLPSYVCLRGNMCVFVFCARSLFMVFVCVCVRVFVCISAFACVFVCVHTCAAFVCAVRVRVRACVLCV
jgi:hypothetical protein